MSLVAGEQTSIVDPDLAGSITFWAGRIRNDLFGSKTESDFFDFQSKIFELKMW